MYYSLGDLLHTEKEKIVFNKEKPFMYNYGHKCTVSGDISFEGNGINDDKNLILTVSFFLLNTGMATEVMRSRLWA